MPSMFYGCNKLNNLDIRNFDYSSLSVGNNLFLGLFDCKK